MTVFSIIFSHGDAVLSPLKRFPKTLIFKHADHFMECRSSKLKEQQVT